MNTIRGHYQRKNYEERTFLLEEVQCQRCQNVFMIDLDYCATIYDENDDCERSIYYCPYCRTKYRIHI